MLAYPKRFLPVNGLSVAHYNIGTGPAVVLLHGFPTSCFLWRDVIASLRRRYQLVAPDLLGLGDTTGPMDADHSLLAQATLVEGLLQRLEIEEAVVVGHDLGGGVAQLLALELPRRVRGLMLVDTIAYDNWLGPYTRKLTQLARSRTLWHLGVRVGMNRAFALARQLFQKGVRHPGSLSDLEIQEYLRPFVLSRSSREHLRRLLLALDHSVTMQAGHRLGGVDRPSAVVWGQDDAFMSVVWARRLAADLRDVELHLLESCGHFVPEERPGELAALIDMFATRAFAWARADGSDEL